MGKPTDQSHMLEQLYALPTFQNGILVLFKVHTRRKRFPLQNQFERCLILVPLSKQSIKNFRFVCSWSLFEKI